MRLIYCICLFVLKLRSKQLEKQLEKTYERAYVTLYNLRNKLGSGYDYIKTYESLVKESQNGAMARVV